MSILTVIREEKDDHDLPTVHWEDRGDSCRQIDWSERVLD